MRVASLSLAAMILMIPTASGQITERGLSIESVSGGKVWCVIVGVNYYQDNAVGTLQFAVKDAELISRCLHAGGVPESNIRVISDNQTDPALKPNGFNILERTKEWFSLAQPDDTVLFYFSGHGFLDDTGDGWLAPMDCDPSRLPETCVAMTLLRQMVTECAAKRRICLLDCCRNVPGKGLAGISAEELAASFKSTSGTITIASCRQGERSYESEKLGHGLFTWYAAEALQGFADENADRIVDSSELYTYLWHKVRHEAALQHRQQNPVEIKYEVSGRFPIVSVPHSSTIIQSPRKPESEIEAILSTVPSVAQAANSPADGVEPGSEKSGMLKWILSGIAGALILAFFLLRPRRRSVTVISSGGRQRSRIASDN